MLLFSLLIILFIDNSPTRIVDWHISNYCFVLLTRYETSFVGNVVAFVSQYQIVKLWCFITVPDDPKGRVIWYGEFLYTCNEIISEFECFV